MKTDIVHRTQGHGYEEITISADDGTKLAIGKYWPHMSAAYILPKSYIDHEPGARRRAIYNTDLDATLAATIEEAYKSCK